MLPLAGAVRGVLKRDRQSSVDHPILPSSDHDTQVDARARA